VHFGAGCKDLKLTWTPGTSPLTGVNSVSYQSRANEEVIIRMGGDGQAMDVETTPEGGCFEAKVTPHIMSPDMQHSIRTRLYFWARVALPVVGQFRHVAGDHGNLPGISYARVFGVHDRHSLQDDHSQGAVIFSRGISASKP
jgi:hypothetical protein